MAMGARARRAATIATLALAAGALIAPVADAHTRVKRTSPSGTASTSITAVKVVFNEQIRSGTLKVKGPDRDTVSIGSGGRDPRNVKRLIVGLEGGLEKGKYKARWKIVAADGHDQDGKFRFKLR